ncbi:MATE family efflux transporter [Duncaniella sp.]|uniref:MATE family efflux transporter n=1 Tax=Duncaniella sp. TaxID=2518496 RepID=UPI0023D1B41D|nr:MATE family efflux transporter [Duncaniella sp.]MDE5904667.1 MATE family efflux transporter [Duncaniella sp.]
MKEINRDILSLAIPSIITNITTPLLALMDVVIVGHMGSADYIAAIAVGGTIFNMLYWLFAFLRMGTSGLTAQANGGGDSKSCAQVLARGLTVALCASTLIILFQKPLLDITLDFLEVKDRVRDLASVYFSILVWGAPASLATFTVTGWLLGMKNARAPMWVAFVVNISNIAVSLLLVLGFGLKVEGVASGTLTAQWLGALTGLGIVAVKYHPAPGRLREIIRLRDLKRFFKVNTDIFFRTLCLIAVTVWFTRTGATQGTVILAVNTLLMQFFILFSYFMDGFAFAGESLCGNLIGGGDRTGLRECVRALFRWSVAMVLLFTLVYAAGGESIMGLLSDDAGVRLSAKEYYSWVIAIPAVGFAAFTWDGIFIGATRTREMLLSMATATAIYFVMLRILFPIIGNHGLWIAFLAYLFTRGLALTAMSRRIF